MAPKTLKRVETVNADLKRAYDTLTAKSVIYTTLWSYYDGNAPVPYVTNRLRDVFDKQDARFTENWAAVVVDSELERIRLNEFVTPDEATTKALNDLFAETELKLDADDVHTASLVCGEAFVFVWKDEEYGIEAYYNDPRLCHVFYQEDNPRRASFACKWWVGADEKRYLNLYYPDRIQYYVSSGKSSDVSSAAAFKPVTDMPDVVNDFGIIPIFHFRRERRTIKSALTNVIEPQDAINKLFSDMMVAAEFGAFPQRFIISNATLDKLKNAPGEIWSIPAGDGSDQGTSAGEFTASQLKNYLDAMDKIAADIAKITRTPKHYFGGQGGDPSGEALIAMEAPLNKKAQATIDRVVPTWQQVAAFMLKLNGNGEITPQDITPQFERPETVQPRTQAEIRDLNNRAGVPLKTTLREEGWTDAQLTMLENDMAEQRKAQATSMALALVQAKDNFNREEVPEAVA